MTNRDLSLLSKQFYSKINQLVNNTKKTLQIVAFLLLTFTFNFVLAKV